MQQEQFLAAGEIRGVLKSLDAHVRGAMALSRISLQLVAALSPSAREAAGDALDREIALAGEDGAASAQVIELLDLARGQLRQAVEEAALVRDLEDALLRAAAALDADQTQETVRLYAAG